MVAWATCSDAYYGVFCLLMAGLSLLVQFISIERAIDVPVVRIAGLRRALDVSVLAVGSFAGAIALRGGGTLEVFGIHVRAHTLYTPMLLLTVLVLARLAVAIRPRLSLRTEASPLQTVRLIAAGGVVMLVLLAPVLYALGRSRHQRQRHLSPPLWRSSPPGRRSARPGDAEPEPRVVGRRDASDARRVDAAAATRSPRPSARSRSSRWPCWP